MAHRTSLLKYGHMDRLKILNHLLHRQRKRHGASGPTTVAASKATK